MTRMRQVCRLIAATAVMASSVSCGDVVRSGKSPMFLVIDSLRVGRGNVTPPIFTESPLVSDVLSMVVSPPPCTAIAPCPTVFNDLGQVSLRIVPKDIGTTTVSAAPSTNNEVTITRFHVAYTRADGRNTPGVDVPFPFDGFLTGTVRIGSQLALGFE